MVPVQLLGASCFAVASMNEGSNPKARQHEKLSQNAPRRFDVWGALFFLLILLVALGLGALMGCANVKPNKGGKAGFKSSQPGQTNEFTLQQPENPAAAANQNYETDEERTEVIPAGSVKHETTTTVDKSGATNTTQSAITFSAPVTNTVRKTLKAAASVGAAQHDDSKKLAASFSAIRPVQYVGIVLILGALALAYFQWWTKAAICGAVGIGMIVVAAIIPGHEGMIIAIGAAVAVIGCLLVLYVYHKGHVDSLQPKEIK
jgi:hypothetical protein